MIDKRLLLSRLRKLYKRRSSSNSNRLIKKLRKRSNKLRMRRLRLR